EIFFTAGWLVAGYFPDGAWNARVQAAIGNDWKRFADRQDILKLLLRRGRLARRAARMYQVLKNTLSCDAPWRFGAKRQKIRSQMKILIVHYHRFELWHAPTWLRQRLQEAYPNFIVDQLQSYDRVPEEIV